MLVASSFDNAGTVTLNRIGAGGPDAWLFVKGDFANNGVVGLHGDSETFTREVSAAGSVKLYDGSTLQFDTVVTGGQTVMDNGANAIVLDKAAAFHGAIAGFGVGDTIDATSFVHGPTTFTYQENPANTGGVLTLIDAAREARIRFIGAGYSKHDFSLGPDSGKGTLINFV